MRKNKSKETKRRMRNLVAMIYGAIGTILAFAGFICALGVEGAIKQTNVPLSTIQLFVIALGIMAIGGYMVNDYQKYTNED